MYFCENFLYLALLVLKVSQLTAGLRRKIWEFLDGLCCAIVHLENSFYRFPPFLYSNVNSYDPVTF